MIRSRLVDYTSDKSTNESEQRPIQFKQKLSSRLMHHISRLVHQNRKWLEIELSDSRLIYLTSRLADMAETKLCFVYIQTCRLIRQASGLIISETLMHSSVNTDQLTHISDQLTQKTKQRHAHISDYQHSRLIHLISQLISQDSTDVQL